MIRWVRYRGPRRHIEVGDGEVSKGKVSITVSEESDERRVTAKAAPSEGS